MSTLYIVATPIGNLQDITLRALETLKRVSVIYCEDTRVTKKLFERHGISTPLRSYHQHSGSSGVKEVIEALKAGDVALVTDAGTPGVADPGNELVSQLVKATAPQVPSLIRRGWVGFHDLKIVPVPGASAVTVAASVCGFNMSRFAFMGYVPKKRGRRKFFEEVAQSEIPVILFEASYRIVKTLTELGAHVRALALDNFFGAAIKQTNALPPQKLRGLAPAFEKESARLGERRERKVVVCRELTKQFESIYRGTVEEVLERVKRDPVKGEYVIVVDKSVKS